ncbi:MAG: hypothetical protein ACREJ6_02145 [Candidatus Methylomirabilis sp.]
MATKTLPDLVQGKFGVKTFPRFNPVISTLGAAVDSWLRQSPNRVAALIVNLSVNNIFIGPFRDVSATKGILVTPNGGSVLLHFEEDFDLVGYEWFAIASAAASPILVVEWVTQREP